LVHPLPPTPNVPLQLIDKSYGKRSSVAGDDSKRRRKKKRIHTTPLNAADISLMRDYDKVHEKLVNSWKSLIELGKEFGYFPITSTSQDEEEVKKHTASLNDASTAVSNSKTIQVLDGNKDKVLKTCLSCTYDSIDLVGTCNKELLISKPVNEKSTIVISNDSSHCMYDIDKLCGRVVVNSTKNWAIIKLSEVHFAIPQNCAFMLSDIAEFQTLVDYIQCSKSGKYDCIVLDPPWENRSAIRSHKYHWLSEYDILKIPLPELCNSGCLVVVWVTNKVRFADFVKDVLFPSWGVEIVGEWHWIKVTKSGELVFDLDSLHKKPYELLLLGRYQGKYILCVP